MMNVEAINNLTPSQVQQLMNICKPRYNKYNEAFGKPFPKQLVAMCLPQREVLFGGSAGGGRLLPLYQAIDR